MTVLSDADLRRHLDAGTLVVTPLGEHAIRPASIDLRLAPVIKVWSLSDGWRERNLNDGAFRISPSDFVLGATLEHVEVPPTLAGVLAGKSSRAREGLVIESAGYVDPGWSGQLTLEIATLAAGINTLTAGMPICQIRFETLLTPSEAPYGSDSTSHYQHSRGPVESRTRQIRRAS